MNNTGFAITSVREAIVVNSNEPRKEHHNLDD